MIIKIQFLLNKDILSDGEKYSFQWVKASFPMTGSYVSDAQYRRNALFIGVLRASDYRITAKIWTPPSEALNFLIFMIIHKYLYI
jgi:hypothetical protein